MGRPRDGSLIEEFVTHTIELPSGELRMLQPADAAEIPDDHQVEWAPLAPYWSVLWRSGVALARQLDGEDLRGKRVVELGCGLAVPSIAAARGGAEVIATDGDIDALAAGQAQRGGELRRGRDRRGRLGGPERAGRARSLRPRARAPTCSTSGPAWRCCSNLLPRLAPVAWVADPGRPGG